MNKKKIITLTVFFVALIILALYIFGGIAENRKERANLEYYNRLLEEDRALQEIIERNLRIKGLADITPLPEMAKRYGPGDINIIYDPIPEDIKRYGRQIAQTLKPYSQERDNEILLVLEALTTQNFNAIHSLEKNANIHKKALEEIQKIRVPQSAQLAHLRLMNNIYRLNIHAEIMAKALTNPEEALQSSENYVKETVNFFRAVEGINVYFTGQGIIFNKEEMVNIYDSIGITS